MKDSNSSSSRHPMTLPGTFWGITAFFNPVGYTNKIENYRLFRESSKRQGLKLLAVELAFGDKPFELTKADADILIQLRTDERNIMWQKERLINVGIRNLPADCDKIVCLDCDIIFHNNTWIPETSRLLEVYVAVQSFSSGIRLPQGISTLSDEDISKLPSGYIQDGGGNLPSFSFARSRGVPLTGRPGGAWALRRSFAEKHYLYDRFILGGGDTTMAYAYCADFRDQALGYFFPNETMLRHYQAWASSAHQEIRGSCWYTPGLIFQLWHGNAAERLYKYRNFLLRHFEYDPACDVQVSREGVLEWASDKPRLHKIVREYFQFRKETGSSFYSFFISRNIHTVQDELETLTKEINALKSSNAYRAAGIICAWYEGVLAIYRIILWKLRMRLFHG